MAAPDLVQALRDVFLREYAKFDPAGADDDCLNFEVFPRPLDPDDCRDKPDDPATAFIPEKLWELMSNLVVDLPSRVGNHLRTSGDEDLGDEYEYNLVKAAVYRTDTAADPAVETDAFTRFTDLQQKASNLLLLARKASVLRPDPIPIVTSSLNPPAFLDPQEAENWLSYPAAGDPAPPTGPVGGALRWRAIDPSIIQAKLADSAPAPTPESSPSPTSEIKLGLAASRKKLGLQAHLHPAKAASGVVGPGGTPRKQAMFNHLQAFGIQENREFSKRTTDDLFKVMVNRKTFGKAQLKVAAQAATLLSKGIVDAPAASGTGMSIRFRYQIVKIERPWIFWPFLEHRNWYVRGELAGAYSNPDNAEEPGRLRWIPKALVVIRDLRITANWQESDKAELQRSFAIGPFGKGARTEFAGQELRVDGVQLLACIDKLMPRLPPRSDPALEGAP
jgi:hypothetical protein